MISQIANKIFEESIERYHLTDNVDTPILNTYPADGLDHLLYKKNWIDTVQWHLEDIIRDPAINAVEALAIKRRIDRSNQERTDMVEYIDSYFLEKFKVIVPHEDAEINTETPAWALDRLSILALKIYHMEQETLREDASDTHRMQCEQKLTILLEQQKDLSQSIDALLIAISEGRKCMKTYRQMKMYNDPALNPVLYSQNQP